jgi:hypothetical protein
VGYGSGVEAQLTVNALVGTVLGQFSYDSPVVSHIFKHNAPTSASATITVFGSNFLNVDTSPEARLGLTLCGTTSWITQTSINCRHPKGTGGNHRVSITVRGNVGCNMEIFTYGAPVVSSVSPANAPTSSGTTLTITGKNFGHKNLSPVATIGSTRCKKTTWIGTTAILCMTSAGVGDDLQMGVEVNKLSGCQPMSFTYDAPTITQSFISNAPTQSGTVVTIFGFNFAERGDAFQSTTKPTVLIDGTACKSMWESATSLTCTTPNGAGHALAVGAAMSGVTGTQAAVFTFDAPVVTNALTGNMVTSGSSSVTLQGTNFAMTDMTPTVFVGMTLCQTTAWISNSQVVCQTRQGGGRALTAIMTVSGVSGTGLMAFTYDAPVVTQLSTENTAASGGVSITVSGFNFGQGAIDPSVLIGNTACTQSQWISGSSVTCLAAAGQGFEMAVGLNLDKVVGTLAGAFTFDAPILSQVIQANGPTSGHGQVTIFGNNFGPDKAIAGVVGATECPSNSWASDTAVVCFAPPGQNGLKNVGLALEVSASGMRGKIEGTYTYDGPVITALYSSNNPTTGGGSITMVGKNFAPTDASPEAQLGITTCLTTSWLTDSSMICRAPAGTGLNHGMTATVGRTPGTQLRSFTYDAPALTYAAMPNAPTSGATDITLSGFNFGSSLKQSKIVASLDKIVCESTQWRSDTTVICRVPEGSDPSTDVSLSVTTGTDTVVGSVPNMFSYDCPVVTDIGQGNFPKDGAALLTINGFNFGNKDYGPKASIGPTGCSQTTWISSSSVTCSTPSAGSSLLSQLTVSVDLNQCSGDLKYQGYFDDASRFDPFAECPCGEEDDPQQRAEVRYLSCGPDFVKELTGPAFTDPNEIMLVSKNGATASVSGLTVSNTGVGMVNEKLFAMPLGAFKFEADFDLSISLTGEFNYLPDTTMLIGVGNGKHFFGVRKSSLQDGFIGTMIQGTYQDDVLISIEKSEQLETWNNQPQLSNQQSLTLEISSYRVGGQTERGMRLRFTHGARDASGFKSYADFTLVPKSDAALGLELVAFRDQKDHRFTISSMKVQLNGCDGGLYSLGTMSPMAIG